jgi:8-oxo-dGTP diphosphatase
MIEVAAAVIQRADGSFLLAQRPAGKVYAGYWEFPGGKVEPGEDAAAALSRELHEELGIDVERAYPWIAREYVYPHGHVRLHFFRVLEWKGEPQSREKQALAWQGGEKPVVAPMLPANAPVLAALSLPQEYAVTDAGAYGVERMLGLLEVRLATGLKLLQIREPRMSEYERERFSSQAIAMAHRYGCRVLTKSPHRDADGIHYTSQELMRTKRRPGVALAAASCHIRPELERAMELGLDFAVLGPVLGKPAYPPLGWAQFAAIARDSSIPVYAIGGLTLADRDAAWRAGAHGLAMIRGAWR